ncbi:MAG: ABC transporter permease [bacterium]
MRIIKHKRKRFAGALSIAAGSAIVASMVVATAIASAGLYPHDPNEIHIGLEYLPPNRTFWLGTDYAGRDVLSRIVAGAQTYLLPAILSISVSLLIGAPLGLIGGYWSGWVGSVASYILNSIASIPQFVFVLIVIAAFKPGILYIVVALGVARAPEVATLMRGRVLSLRGREFIEAAKALGAGSGRIIFRHIFWYHCRSLLIVQASLGMGVAILVEASLSYLGYGVQDLEAATWGNMVAAARGRVFQGDFLPALIPAGAIAIAILGFQLLGDGLNTLLEER